MPGVALQDLWTDVPPISSHAQERLGYPTQKPVALLERIVQASSNEGDVVLDPFCGFGTTIAAAQKLGRTWIGIDVTHLAVGLMKLRLKDSFGMLPVGTRTPSSAMRARLADDVEQPPTPSGGVAAIADGGVRVPSYRVIGQPEDLDGAKELAERDKYGFGSEAGSKVGKKGADGGIDGMLVFTDDTSGKAKKVIVSVKGGHNVNVSHIFGAMRCYRASFTRLLLHSRVPFGRGQNLAEI